MNNEHRNNLMDASELEPNVSGYAALECLAYLIGHWMDAAATGGRELDKDAFASDLEDVIEALKGVRRRLVSVPDHFTDLIAAVDPLKLVGILSKELKVEAMSLGALRSQDNTDRRPPDQRGSTHELRMEAEARVEKLMAIIAELTDTRRNVAAS